MKPFILALALFLIGLYAVMTKKNLIKIVIGLSIMEYAVNLFLLLVGYRGNFGMKNIVPIRTCGEKVSAFVQRAVDPLPQALIVTSIVIGLGVTALIISLCMKLYDKYGTMDVSEIRRLRG